jgi:glycine cleavage system transcriptional repressor
MLTFAEENEMAETQHLALIGLGPDRPGIVAAATRVLKERGANIEDSRAAVLGGEFGFMVLASFPPGGGTVAQCVEALESATGLNIVARATVSPEAHRQSRAIPYRVEANSLDHEGVVHAITQALYRSGVNIITLDSAVTNAPVTGTPVFSFAATVDVPADVPLEDVRAALTHVARLHNLDIEARLA